MIALEKLTPRFAQALEWAMHHWGITTPDRQAMFLAQLAHESGGFRRLEEDFRYSGQRLRAVFPRYFPDDATAAAYARQPEKIANRVYANRMGNGPEASGDGWRYRGRGLIQLTGRNNYTRAREFIPFNLAENPDLLLSNDHAICDASGWFWSSRGCNALADKGDFPGTTKKINGGMQGQADRERWLRKIRG